ncbi:hypothetical protein HYPSUDRAFT_145592 [Hypholoma sublateritium FD-334 SS-4]|uniref:Tyr recombinase domain-containing protein n=1 Tax=Hypholoma sublateritium (strain FD-334 SS-4) TaxID=945553 RepID=A0A0D2KTV0_HYPSF|nr:hypothetical protein HYPSUDRAFT_145592 [Hypholoma sublateritium FD-334 SS-4]
MGRSGRSGIGTHSSAIRESASSRLLFGQIRQQWGSLSSKQGSIEKPGDKRGHKKNLYNAREEQYTIEGGARNQQVKRDRQPIKGTSIRVPQGVSASTDKIGCWTSLRVEQYPGTFFKQITAFPVVRTNSIPSILRNNRNPRNNTFARQQEISEDTRPSAWLRPNCRVGQRIFQWKGVNTPPPATINDPVIKLLADLASQASLRDPKSYGSAIKKFHTFCDNFSIPEAQRLPASFQLLHSFALWVFEPISVQTARKYLSGVRAWHIAQGWPPPLSKDDYQRIDWSLRGMQNMFGTRTRPMRPPMTIPMLHALKSSLNLEDPFDACIWAMVLCAFWGMMRFGEVSVASRTSFDGRKHLKRGDVVMGIDLDGTEYARLDLPSAKTAKMGEIQSVFIVPQSDLCPIKALKNMAKVTPAGRLDPLFSWQDRRGVVRPMVRSKALGRINAILQAWGWGTTFGHSPRIGGASFFLAEGKNPEHIRIAGRWKSLAYQVWCRPSLCS